MVPYDSGWDVWAKCRFLGDRERAGKRKEATEIL